MFSTGILKGKKIKMGINSCTKNHTAQEARTLQIVLVQEEVL